jgi:transposase IS66 family protein
VWPLIDALSRYVMAGERVHGDDTEVPVLEPGLGRTRKAQLWTYVRDGRPYGCADPPAVLYRYSPDRKGAHPQEHLRDFNDILQADGVAKSRAILPNHGERLRWIARKRCRSGSGWVGLMDQVVDAGKGPCFMTGVCGPA